MYAHAKQVWGNGQFQQANDDMDIQSFLQQTTMKMTKNICPSIVDDTDTGRVFHEQTTMKRATCFRSLDGIKDSDKFNSKYKYSMPNAETSVMKKKLYSESFYNYSYVDSSLLHFRISLYGESQ